MANSCQPSILLVLERTPKYRTSNTPNIECLNIKLSEHHILAQNRTSNMSNITKTRTVREHQTVSSKTSLVTQQQDRTLNTSEHHILAQNWTLNMSNITKNWTVHEHWTVHSKTTGSKDSLCMEAILLNHFIRKSFKKTLRKVASLQKLLFYFSPLWYASMNIAVTLPHPHFASPHMYVWM